MADFVGNIWLSIFTAGPTPTLLVATNVAFAALQLVLLGLLLATYSVHFIVLSFLCGGLWWSINWFAHEVLIVQAEEEAKKAREDIFDATDVDSSAILGDHSGMDTSDETDETEMPPARDDARSQGVGIGFADGASGLREPALSTALRPTPVASDAALKKRRAVMESSSDLSTDSEWEKIDS